MGLMDSFISAMKISEGNDDDMFEDDDEYLDDEDIATERVVSVSKTETVNEPKRQPVSRITPVRQQKKVIGSGMEVCVIKPSNIEDGRSITDTLLDNRTVVLNLEGLDVAIAQRIIDFSSGSCYAMKGNMQKISNYIFVITPASIDISGDLPESMTTGGALDIPPIQEY